MIELMHVELAGTRRMVAYRTGCYSTPPEPGTILGPRDTTREFLVVLGQDADGMTLLGYATVDDLAAAAARVRTGLPARSMAELPQHAAPPVNASRVTPRPG